MNTVAQGIPPRLVLPALLLLALPLAAQAQDRDFNRYTLEDLGGVFVRAEAIGCDATGATPESVRLRAEGVLAAAEVEMLTEGEMLRNPALPELRVQVDCAGGVPGALAYTVSVKALQAVQMIRDNQITLPEAVTWHTSVLGVRPAAEAGAGVEAAVDEAVGRFAAAYAASNRAAAGGGGGGGGR